MNKTKILDIIDKMPDEISVGDLIAEIHFKEKLEKGLEQINEGKTISHEEAKQRLSKWLK